MYKYLSAFLAVGLLSVLYFRPDNEAAKEDTPPVTAPVIEIVIEVSTPVKQQVIDYDQLECLAKNIYFEARGESLEGQIAVSQVVMNRVQSKHFPNTICEVVYQGQLSTWYLEVKGIEVPVRNRCQFSWWCDGRSDNPKDMTAWGEALTVAAGVIRNEYNDYTNGAMWYHANYVKPDWRHQFTHVTDIGNHKFYASNLN